MPFTGHLFHLYIFHIFISDQEQLPELNVHFRSQSFHTSMYASSWFLTLFLTFLPLPIATRIFDIFMYEVWTQETSCTLKHPYCDSCYWVAVCLNNTMRKYYTVYYTVMKM